MTQSTNDAILWRHLRDLPYFRAMLRAVEDSFYQDLEIPGPILDVGCGDGHFASVAFSHPIDVGLDPWWAPLVEAHSRKAYRVTVQADGAQMPFPEGWFGSAISNSVLEHIPHIDAVLADVARVVRPGGLFVFCVPNHRFPELLLGTQVLNSLGLKSAGAAYSRLFNRISRHAHTERPEVWEERLARVGFTVERCWDYFPPEALHVLELGHAFGLPALVSRKLSGRWILWKSRANLFIPWGLTRKYLDHPKSDLGVETFFIARRNTG